MADDDILDAFRRGMKEAARQRKSDDIILFIRKNWKLFCASRRQMDLLCEELEQRGDLSVAALADALGLPDTVLFKKVKVVDAAKLVMRPSCSELLSLFERQRELRGLDNRCARLCLFAVAGDHSIVITNMRIARIPGAACLVLEAKESDFDTHAFPASDVAGRLPSLFGSKEE